MGDYQPRLSDVVRVNKIKEKTAASGITLDNTTYVDALLEKTAAAGISINGLFKAVGTKLQALTSGLSLGDSTTVLTALWANALKTTGAAMSILVESAHNLTLGTNNTTRLTLTSSGKLQKRLGHTGFASGGEVEEFTSTTTTTSTTPTTWLTYTIGATNTQVAIIIDMISRDNVSGNQCTMGRICTGSRAGGGAVAGSVNFPYTYGSALHVLTLSVSGNDLLIQIANNSGTNTTYAIANVLVLPLSTSS